MSFFDTSRFTHSRRLLHNKVSRHLRRIVSPDIARTVEQSLIYIFMNCIALMDTATNAFCYLEEQQQNKITTEKFTNEKTFHKKRNGLIYFRICFLALSSSLNLILVKKAKRICNLLLMKSYYLR